MWMTYCLLCGCPDNPCGWEEVNTYISDCKYYSQFFLNGKIKGFSSSRGPKLSDYERYRFEKFLNLTPEKQEKVKKSLRRMPYITKWMTKCVMLLATGEVIKCEPTEYLDGTFTLANPSKVYPERTTGSHVTAKYYYDEKSLNYKFNRLTTRSKEIVGIFLHQECYDFACKEKNTKIHYGMIADTAISEVALKKAHVHMNRWQQQFFDYPMCAVDGGIYNLIPNSEAWKSNCRKAMSALEMNDKYFSRTGPPLPTKFYLPGTFKMGQDGNVWKLKDGKWMPTKLKSVSDKIKPAVKKHLRFAYEQSSKGYFYINGKVHEYE